MEKAGLNRREREKLRHRQEIMNISLGLFTSKGFHNVTMSKIAEESEFAIGTLYNFFKSKDDLYEAIIIELIEKHRKMFKENLDLPLYPLEKIKKIIHSDLKFISENADIIRAFQAELLSATTLKHAEMNSKIEAYHNEIISYFADIIREGIESNFFRSATPLIMAHGLKGMIEAYCTIATDKDSIISRKKYAEEIIEMFFAGVLKR
ncbi:MAG: TetR/AcrR family transcriptional regulator [Verrucomicrobiota bacterium]|nr:TetR/AcrR family transcriptional regulator [Verrucomicrobiota bacterium]